MKMATAGDNIGKRVARFQGHLPVEYGVITGVGRKKSPMVYVRLDGRRWPVGIAPELLELSE